MININQWTKAGTQMLTSNAPAILTAFGAVGVVTTAILTGKASMEAARRIDVVQEAIWEEDPNDMMTVTRKAQLTWMLYIPAVTTGVLSCGAILMSHRISSRRAAMLAAAYALNEGKLEEYQDKIREKLGVKKEKDARDEIVHDKVQRTYDEGTVIFSPLDGKVLIHDEYSGRFFYSSVEAIKQYVNEMNHEIIMSNSGYATLSDFYDLIDLPHVSTSDYFGWNTSERLEIDWSTTTTPDGKTAVHSFVFVNPPVINPGSSASFR